ncbi:MAG: nucleoside triphosphate pyrophosphohydrolase [Deltaproteobacteria bacterium]|nr:nucleoside triphosphate pyrophosphohydrolase [Deltaproteobacteria bacterium]
MPDKTPPASPGRPPLPVPDDPDPVDRLLAIMGRLRDRETGCPWDREQTFQTLKPYLLEETYEVLDAIDSGDPDRHKGELGDLLLQIVFQSQIANEEGRFGFRDVADAIATKLIRRHPHVFGDKAAASASEVVDIWEQVKGNEEERPKGLLSGVPRSMPALARAVRLSRTAARVGFDWPDVTGVLDKIREEAEELAAASDMQEKLDELGDLLFALSNLARKLDLDPEEALQRSNTRFSARFADIERQARERSVTFEGLSLQELDRMWEEAKKKLGR